MKTVTEKQIERAAGIADLTAVERQDVAAAVARQCTAVVARCLLAGNFSDLRRCLRREEKEKRIKKAMEQWIAAHRAIYDPHRQKWLIWECPHCGGGHPPGCCAQDGHGG